MAENQKEIYYASGESAEAISRLPIMQQFKKKGIEVFFLVDPMDEAVIDRVKDFDGKSLKSIQKGKVELPETEEEKAVFGRIEKHYKTFCDWVSKTLKEEKDLGVKIGEVKVPKKLVDSPCAIVSSEHGMTPRQQKLSK